MIEKRKLHKSQLKQLKLDNTDDRKVALTDSSNSVRSHLSSPASLVTDVSVSHVLWRFNWIGLLDDIVIRFDAAEPVFPSSIGR